MDKALRQAWRVIDYMIAEEYDGDRVALMNDVGNLDELAVKFAELIEAHDLEDERNTTDLYFALDRLYF